MTLYTLFGIAFMIVAGFISSFNIIGASKRYRDEKIKSKKGSKIASFLIFK